MHGPILIVDDDADIRETLQTAFAMLGYEVAAAANGQEALDILKTNGRPCFILLDLMMPIMSGPQFCEKRKSDPNLAQIPVIVLTADGQAFQKAAHLGVNEVLTKPIEFNALRGVAQKYC